MKKKYILEADAYQELSEEYFLDNSFFLDSRISSSYNCVDGLVDYFFGEIYRGRNVKLKEKKIRTLEKFLINLFFVYANDGSLIVPMDSGFYTANGRRPENVDSYEDIRAIIKYLQERGDIEVRTGSKASGKATHIWVEKEDLQEAYESILQTCPKPVEWKDMDELIISKTKKKKQKRGKKKKAKIRKYEENRYFKKELERISLYNSNISKFTYSLEDTISNKEIYPYILEEPISNFELKKLFSIYNNIDYLPSYMHRIRQYVLDNPKKYKGKTWEESREKAFRKHLSSCAMASIPKSYQNRRIYNDGTDYFGGRYFGSTAQRLPKELRKDLQINGEETKELDFEALHVSMAYHERGLDVPALPYIYHSDDPLRKVVKLALNTAINANDKEEAVQSIIYELNVKRYGYRDILSSSKYGGGKLNEQVRRVLSDVYDAHEPVTGLFCSGKGVQYQRKDSDIASEILWHFTKQDIPVIPIHDSFIIQEQHAEELRVVMEEKYFDVFKKKIRVK